MQSNGISIIIPTLNEAHGIGILLEYLNSIINPEIVSEILVVDGGSSDNTLEIASNFNVTALESEKGRAKQMNFGAQRAQGTTLYFLHADTFPPVGFDRSIIEAQENGFQAGCFRMKFDTKNPILKFFAYLSKINHILCRGGDQSLFITKETFRELGGFNERYLIYEDTEFITRLYRQFSFTILSEQVITSARKYRDKGWWRVQFHFGVIHLKNLLGSEPTELYEYYEKKFLS